MFTAPLTWACGGFPLAGPEEEIVRMEDLIAALNAQVDTTTDEDTTALGPVLHICHLLKAYQGTDGRWPALLNARLGETIGEERTFAPVPLFRRLNALLDSSEFLWACELAEDGGYLHDKTHSNEPYSTRSDHDANG